MQLLFVCHPEVYLGEPLRLLVNHHGGLPNVGVDECPVLVLERLQVPLNRFAQPLAEFLLFLPPDFLQLRSVDHIPEVVEVAVGNLLDPVLKALPWLHDLHKLLCDLQHGAFVLSPDVVHLPQHAVVDHCGVSPCRILTVHEGTLLQPATLNGHLLVLTQQPDEARDDLLWVLPRPIDIVPAGDEGGDVKRLLVRLDNEFCSGLRRRVRVGGVQEGTLSLPLGNLAVNLVRRDVDELLQLAIHLGALEEVVCPKHVGAGEAHGVPKAVVDVGLGSEVDDGVDVAGFEDVHHQVGVPNVALDKGVVGEPWVDVLRVRAVVETIQVVDLYVGVAGTKLIDEVRSDEAAPPCD
eukprot:Sspe_Gene.4335::Locus_1427_Transcript_1_1_Confidence_1.000_Length_1384::g.4335::m.4335